MNDRNLNDPFGVVFGVSGNAKAFEYSLKCLELDGVPPNQVIGLGNVIGPARDTIQCLEIAKCLFDCCIGNWEEWIINRKSPPSLVPRAAITFSRLAKSVPETAFENWKRTPIEHLGVRLHSGSTVDMTILGQIHIGEKGPQINIQSETRKTIGVWSGMPGIARNGRFARRLPIDRNLTVKWSDVSTFIEIGAVGFSKCFLLGNLNYAIVSSDRVLLRSQKFKFYPEDYDL